MKNIIQYIGIIILIIFSFFYTEKTVTTIKNQDPLMIELQNIKEEYSISPINAEITDDKIIPGMAGCEVNIEDSYYNLKRLGTFNSNLLEYKKTLPTTSLKDNYDKYITSGNKLKNSISLIFKVEGDTNIDKVVNILKSKNIKASFFIDGKYIESNIDKVSELIKDGYEVLNYGYDNKYDKDLLIWNNNLIERLNYNNPKFCYVEKSDINTLNLCSLNKMKTVVPNIIIKQNPLLEVKEQINKGSLISFKVNDITEKELGLVINYIIQKGYNIELLSSHLEESTLNTCKKCDSCD